MGEGVLDRRYVLVLDLMHGRSRMTIRPSHPYSAGTKRGREGGGFYSCEGDAAAAPAAAVLGSMRNVVVVLMMIYLTLLLMIMVMMMMMMTMMMMFPLPLPLSA